MKKIATKLGLSASIVALIATIGYSVAQILQIAGIISSPLDGILIYGFSMILATPFMLAILAVHYTMPGEKQIWSHAGVLLAVMYAIFVTIVYAEQLATVMPASPSDQRNLIPAFVMYPHSFYWTLDGLGYIFMGFSAFFCAFAFDFTKEQRWLRIFFLSHGLITPLVCIAYFYPHFSTALLYFGSPWVITATGCMLSLYFYFKRRLIREKQSDAVPISTLKASEPVSY